MGTHARAVSSPGRANSAWASPRERRLLGWIPACRASSASLARTSRIEKAPMAADEDVKRPENAATRMTPDRAAPVSNDDQSSSAWGSDSACARDERRVVTSEIASTAGPCARIPSTRSMAPRSRGESREEAPGTASSPMTCRGSRLAPAILAAIERAHRDANAAS